MRLLIHTRYRSGCSRPLQFTLGTGIPNFNRSVSTLAPSTLLQPPASTWRRNDALRLYHTTAATCYAKTDSNNSKKKSKESEETAEGKVSINKTTNKKNKKEMDNSIEDDHDDVITDARARSIEEIYQKKDPIEHILSRPDTYVGSTTAIADTRQPVIVHDASDGSVRVEQRILQQYVPALYRIIDELLVNAIDNFNRPRTGTTKIKVDVDRDTGWVHVYNNGKSVPVHMHKKEKIYVPELVFGHLLTGSNFDDQEVKFTGGRNGYGAKLANIFAQEFVVEIADARRRKLYRQTWTENMKNCGEAQISQWDKGQQEGAEDADYIKVSLLPDFSRFQTGGKPMKGLSEDFVHLLERRVHDLAACNNGITMYWNGSHVLVRSFMDYIQMFYEKQDANQLAEDKANADADADADAEEVSITTPSFAYKRFNKQWEIAVGPVIESSDEGQSSGGTQQYSFVNSISTRQGGTHVTHAMSQLTRKIIDYIKKNHKDLHLNIAPSLVASQMTLFMNCRIENPAFDSQTKETLTTRSSQFASSAEIPDSFIRDIANNTTVIDDVINMSLMRTRRQHDITMQASKSSSRARRKALDIPKLHDANWAGTSRSHECTLIITEGDSAKALAIAGLSVVGRDKYGVFPLKGKMLNVRDASMEQIEKNQEFQNLRKILGLKMNIEYKPPFTGLRYGKVMLMCDQDHDGSHIKGLFLNMMQYFFPSLLLHGYVEEFITPIVKATHSRTREVKSFFTIPEYERWRDALDVRAMPEWQIKYYKGLGTSTAAEARQYFSNLDKHRIGFTCRGEEDFQLIDMAFSKTRADERKEWLVEYKEGVHVDHSRGVLPLDEFINKELVLFSQYDNVRSIPSLLDGLKVSQRKVLYGCFKRRLVHQEVKVAQLAGYVSEQSAYHHGEQSLHSTIIAMAQDFCGSNNIPLLYPSGQFGTRLQGGKDAASARYIFTRLNKVTRLIYMEADDPILNYRIDDGDKIEPYFYVPIIPMVLVNGAEGMGTGWSTSIPCFNPLDIIDNLLTMLDMCKEDPVVRDETISATKPMFISEILHERLKPMNVWYRNFKGDIEPDVSANRLVSRGIVQMDRKKGRISITELPIGRWTENFKDYLTELVNSGAESKSRSSKKTTSPSSNRAKNNSLLASLNVHSFTEHHTENEVRFDVQLTKESIEILEALYNAGDNDAQSEQHVQHTLLRLFKLETFISMNNMTLFDSRNSIQQYASAIDILNEFFAMRLKFYVKRKRYMQAQQEHDLSVLENKQRFLLLIIEGKIRMHQKNKTEIIDQLRQNGILGMDEISKSFSPDNMCDAVNHSIISDKSYDYLMNMPLHQLTNDNLRRLDQQIEQRRNQIKILGQQSARDMWRHDLQQLRESISTPSKFVQ